MFCSVVSSCWIDPFIICNAFLCLVTIFVLKSIFLDINIATTAFFLFWFAWNILFYPFNFSLCVCVITSEVSVLQAAYKLKHLVHLHLKQLLIGMYIAILLIVFLVACVVLLYSFFCSCSLPLWFDDFSVKFKLFCLYFFVYISQIFACGYCEVYIDDHFLVGGHLSSNTFWQCHVFTPPHNVSLFWYHIFHLFI